METLYTAKATATNGREGHVKTDDGALDLKLVKPGASGDGTNPEQLFASGYSACFAGALGYIATQRGIETGDITIKADVNLNKVKEGFAISASIDAHIDGVDQDTAQALTEAAHVFCPYSKAIRGNVDVTLSVNGQEL